MNVLQWSYKIKNFTLTVSTLILLLLLLLILYTTR